MSAAATPARGGPRVWDAFVRLFHWSLVGCIVLDGFVLDDGRLPHRALGYVALGLVAARIVWGFIGSRHARFADFWPRRERLARHVASLLAGRPEADEGHNPLGALMMLTLLALVVLAGITGWMQTLDAFWGEEWLEELHEGIANGLLGLAALHAAAAVVMGRIERTRLVKAMFTGIKERT